jgi:hypothetical protein
LTVFSSCSILNNIFAMKNDTKFRTEIKLKIPERDLKTIQVNNK